MAEMILMPRQGNSVESCILNQWRIKEGDTVEPKTIVADVETDKATFEIEAGCSGTVLKLLFPEGEDVPVMQPIAVVGKPGESFEAQARDTSAPSAAAPTEPAAPVAQPGQTAPAASPAPQSAPTSPNQDAKASPRARMLGALHGIDPAGLPGTGPEGRVIERDVRKVMDASAPATKAAIEEALRQGIRLPPQGSGLGGRVVTADLKGAAPDQAVQIAPSQTSRQALDFPGPRTETKIRSIRKVIADRMMQSLSSTAQFTLNASAPAVHLQELRARLKASNPELGLQGITIGDILVYATARTLKRFTFMNAHMVADTISEFQNVHMGIACDTPRGLMVPVIRHASSLSLKEISDETKRLAEACRNGTAKPEELSGSTFSISNLGASGIESFTPVLNAPEVAILGICTIQPKPVQQGKDVVFLPHVGLSLTINHMVVDGAPAARFLKELCSAIAECDILLAQ